MSDVQKVAVISGASQGIGAALVDAYRGLGYAVVGSSRTIEPSTDPSIVNLRGDIAERRTAETVIETAVRRFGRVDTIINNAGVFIAKPFVDYTEEDFANAIGVNVAGFYHLTQVAIPHLLKSGAGHVINITTTLVERPNGASPPRWLHCRKAEFTRQRNRWLSNTRPTACA